MSVPKWLLEQEGLTLRQWKAKKRAQLKRVEKAFKEFRFGSAYTPGYSEVNPIQYSLSKMKKAQSFKNWGR